MRIKYETSRLKVIDVQVRTKKDDSQYAVISIEFPDRFDAISLRKNPKHKKKHISMLCFTPHAFPSIIPENEYIFKGFVSFGYGSTFLVIEDFYDAKTGESFLAGQGVL